MDWKEKAGERKDELILKAEQRRSETSAKKLEEYGKELERSRKKEQEAIAKRLRPKYKKLAKDFKCNVCGLSSKKPTYYTADGDWGLYTAVDWQKPADLTQCEACRKWTCGDHIHDGICKTCALNS